MDKLLRNIDRAHVIYAPSQKCFLTVAGKQQDQSADPTFVPDNYISYNGQFKAAIQLWAFLIFFERLLLFLFIIKMYRASGAE